MVAQGQSSTGNYFNSSWKYLAPDFARPLYLKQSALWLESDPLYLSPYSMQWV